jgi:GNAT superfamily N-acetyltransferase
MLGPITRYVQGVVRLRRDQDLQPLVALLGCVYSADGYPANWPDDPIRWLAAKGTIAAWIFEHGRDLVGHLALTAPDPDRAWPQWQEALQQPVDRLAVMRRLFVAPNSRRQGVATHLIKAAERTAAERGLQLVLDVADHNRPAIGFWKTHGWREVGEATLPPGDEGRALRLLLLVAPPAGH